MGLIFKFPQKKIVLDCFTDNEVTIKTAPIELAIKHMPDWWKALPSTYMANLNPAGTMKNCIGMIDFYKYSVALPLWSDLAITVRGGQYSWQFADTATNAIVHKLNVEATGFMPKEYSHLKIVSPWALSCKEDINWMWNTPLYSLNDNPDILIPPAIISYRHNTSSNINMLFDTSRDRRILIKLGTPIVAITPMSDRKVEVVRHLISTQEFIGKVKNTISFTRKYDKVKELTEKFQTCPFHNHLRK